MSGCTTAYITDSHKNVQFYQNILKELGFELKHDSVILDFGCGAGGEVYQLRKKNYHAFGCDIVPLYEEVQNLCREEKLTREDEIIFRTIDVNNYRIPFADNSFDFVFSNQVFEHVKNYPETLAEIYRVLKPGACSLHFFPSRYRPVECHVFVPFAGIFQSYHYLKFWAFLGIRNAYQKGFSYKETAAANHEFLHKRTMYYTKKKIAQYVLNQFKNISFIEHLFIKYSEGRLKKLYPLSQKIPFITSLIRTFHTRVIFFTK